MSILKKAVGIGLAASLLASTMATILPGTVFASGTVTTVGAGTVTAGMNGPAAALTVDGVITFSQIGDVVPGVVTVTAPAGIAFQSAGWNYTGGIAGVPVGVIAPDAQSVAFTVTAGNTAAPATMTFAMVVYNTNGAVGTYDITTTGPFNWLPASQTIATITVAPAAAASLDITLDDYSLLPGETVNVNVQALDAFGNPTPAGPDTVLMTQSSSTGCGTGLFSGLGVWAMVGGVATGTFTVPATAGGCSYTLFGVLNSDLTVLGAVSLVVLFTPTPPYGPISVTEATVTSTAITGIARGGPYAGTGEYRITEKFTDTFPSNGFKMYVRIRDADGFNTVHFDTTASSVALSPASLGLSASFLDDSTLVVTSAFSDVFILETLIIGGLKVKADTGAAVGAIRTFYALAHQLGATGIDDPLSIDFGGKTVGTSTGFLFNSEPPGFIISFPTVQQDLGVPDFTATDALNGQLVIADPAGESVDILAASLPYLNPFFLFNQDLVTDPFADPHAAGTRVSQTHVARNCDTPWPGTGLTPVFTCRLPSIGSVGDALLLTSTSTFIQRGLPNGQLAGMVRINEQSTAQIAAGTVITIKLDSAVGVKYATVAESRVNSLNGLGTRLTMANVGTCDVSADRLTLTCTTNAADSGGAISQIEIYNILLDASNASAAAAKVVVTVTVGSLTVVNPATLNNTATIATLNNTADGTALSIPTVIIGENDQLTGTVQIREAAAGTFGADPTLGSWMFVCYVDNDVLGSGIELFTRAPFAVVTAGDLQLRSVSDPTLPGLGVAAGTAVRGEIFFGNTNCASWFIYQYSTKASTIEIRGMGADGLILPAGPGNGPQVNVPASMTPGPSTLSLKTSPSYNSGGSQFDLVVNANRAYGATPVVAAASNPEIFRGRISQAAGDVTVTETKTYQLGTYFNAVEIVGYYIVPNSGLDIVTPRIYFDSNRDKPVIETNSAATGLVASFGGFFGFYSGTQAVAFDVIVQQRAFVPISGSWVPGVLTVKNIKYSTTNEAPFGNVVLRVRGGPVFIQPAVLFSASTLAENPANFDQTVVNAHVVNPVVFPSVDVAAGYKGRETSKYITFGTLIVKSGTYVTIRVNVGRQFQNLPIQFFQKNGKSGTWVRKTIGRVDANGFAFWSTRPPTLSGTGFDTYVYYRAYFGGTETLSSQWSQTTARVVARANGPFTVK